MRDVQLVDVHGAHITSAPTAQPSPLDTAYQARREPEPGWREQLAAFSQPNEEIPYLWLDWLAGEPYEPVQRWALWEILPAKHVDRMIVAQRVRGIPEREILLADVRRDLELEAPSHPSRGKWVRDHRVPGKKRWSADSLVNQQQWELWRSLRGFATLFWIIQGTKGGHKRSFTENEEVRLRRMKLPWRPPIPGSLAYAPFDGRVLEQLERFDRLTKVEGDFRRRVKSHQTAVEIREAERVAAYTTADAEANAWLRLQLADALDALPDQRVTNIVEHLPVAEDPDRKLLIRGGMTDG